MQASHDTIRAHTLIVLAKMNTMSQNWSNLLFKLSFAEALEEISSSIAEEAWLYNENAINISFNNIHLFNYLISSKNISSVNLKLYIIQTSIIAVSDDSMALSLEGFEVVLYSTTKEGTTLF